MNLRLAVPMAAVALGFIAPAELAAQQQVAPTVQTRPALMSQCDQLRQKLDTKMLTAMASQITDGKQAREEGVALCNSGKPEEGIEKLEEALWAIDPINE